MEWNDIGTIKSRNKENSLVSGPWTGVKLQQDKITVKSIPKLKVFKDPDIKVIYYFNHNDNKETMEQLRVSSVIFLFLSHIS